MQVRLNRAGESTSLCGWYIKLVNVFFVCDCELIVNDAESIENLIKTMKRMNRSHTRVGKCIKPFQGCRRGLSNFEQQFVSVLSFSPTANISLI